MPSLGADMTAGTLAKWRVAAGDTVSSGDIIAEVETDKGVIEVEVFEGGVVEKLLVEEGEKVPVGTALAEIGAGTATATGAGAGTGTGTGTVSATVAGSVSATVSAAVPASAPAAAPGSIISAGASGVDLDGPMASPAVRRRAHELDVSLESVHGSGDHGRITLDDVQGVVPVQAVPAASRDRVRISPYARRIATERGVDVTQVRGTGAGGAIQASDVFSAEVAEPSRSVSPAERMQRAIAAAMTRANDEIPHYYVEQSIDMGSALAWLRETNASLGVSERLVSGVLVLRAVARALRKHKKLNATWQGGEAVPNESIHVGLAVSLRGGGLVAPALRNTEEGSLSDLMARMTDLVARARAGTLRSSEMTSATITLTSLGERGVESVTPIIFPPQVAIVGCGATAERPWVVDGQVVARPVMRVTLGADHRVSNGHEGARFLSTLDRLLQEPEKL
jgi:pyruvate dehydrogenase E2 component (dihydrolipoamide acetyltransferase)